MEQAISVQRQQAQVYAATLQIQGMKCAGCVQAVEKTLMQHPGVVSASVNLVTAKAAIAYHAETTSPLTLAQSLTQVGFPSQVEPDFRHEPPAPDSNSETPFQAIVQRFGQISGAILLVGLSMVGHLQAFTPFALPVLSHVEFHWALATLALLGPGRSILIEGSLSLWRRMPNMNALVSLGAVTAYLASDVALVFPQLGWECFFDAPVMIMGLVLLGRTLEEQARNRATADFRALLTLQPATARRILNPHQSPMQTDALAVSQVQVGTLLHVLPGDKFPVDGVIRAGQSAVNEAMLTGESLPVTKGVGDAVMAGTLNLSQALVIEATRTGAETALAQIVQAVETAQARKAPIQRLADRVSGYFVYGVMAIALSTFFFWSLWGTHLWPEVLQMAGSTSLHHSTMSAPMPAGRLLLSLKLAIAVLVVACPCALGLATPTAIVVGTSLGAEQGLLIRGGDVLETVHHLDTVVFDKTGTLTTGSPVVTDYWLYGQDLSALIQTPEDLLQVAASLEVNSSHPFALALQAKADALHLERRTVEDGATHIGLGVSGTLQCQSVLLGSEAWLESQGVQWTATRDSTPNDPRTTQGCSILYLAVEGRAVGGIALHDPIRPDAAATLAALRQQNLKVLMLTGDQAATAIAIGQQVGLSPDDIHAGISPTAKAAFIQHLQAEGRCVAMVGDGINDAPALAQANVGIALSSGTEVAIETAQIVLMHNHLTQQAPRLRDVSRAFQLSQATFRTIQQNLFWALAYNVLGIPLAAGVFLPAFGLVLSPAAAAALMAFSSVSVVTNALFLRQTQRNI